MLKAVKHLSMNSTLLDVLQNANAIEILVRILDEQSSGPHSTVCVLAVTMMSFTYLESRKCPIISSRPASTSAASTNRVKRRPHKLELSLVSNESLRRVRR